MKQVKNNKKKLAAMKVDKSLDKYLLMNPFKEKVEKANEFFRIHGAPKLPKQ